MQDVPAGERGFFAGEGVGDLKYCDVAGVKRTLLRRVEDLAPEDGSASADLRTLLDLGVSLLRIGNGSSDLLLSSRSKRGKYTHL